MQKDVNTVNTGKQKESLKRRKKTCKNAKTIETKKIEDRLSTNQCRVFNNIGSIEKEEYSAETSQGREKGGCKMHQSMNYAKMSKRVKNLSATLNILQQTNAMK